MRKLHLLLAALVVMGLRAHAAVAYEINTHRWIMQQASGELGARNATGEYDEVIAHVDDLKYGVEHEDDLADGDANPVTIRVMHHFYRPIDDHGLRFPGFSDFPSSYHWGAESNAQNECDWSDAVAAYRSGAPGSLQVAYRCLGQVIHLVQDATVPAHTHLDIHGPQEPEDYEGYCQGRTRSDTDADLPRARVNSLIPMYANLRGYWDGAGRQAYFRNRFPGDLRDQANPMGRIKLMFPSLAWDATWGQWDITNPDVGNYDGDPSADDEWWEAIANVDNVNEQPGWYYFEGTNFTPVMDKTFFDPLNPTRDSYGAPAGTLAAGFARDLIPVAILHSAGLLKKWNEDVVPDVTVVRIAAAGLTGEVAVARGDLAMIEVDVENRGHTVASARLDTPWREATSGTTGALAPGETLSLPDGFKQTRQYVFDSGGLALGRYTLRAEVSGVKPGDRTVRNDARELVVNVVAALPPDAGVARDGGGDAGASDDAGVDPGGDSGGCGCRAGGGRGGAGGRAGAGAGAGVLLLLALVLWRRHR